MNNNKCRFVSSFAEHDRCCPIVIFQFFRVYVVAFVFISRYCRHYCCELMKNEAETGHWDMSKRHTNVDTERVPHPQSHFSEQTYTNEVAVRKSFPIHVAKDLNRQVFVLTFI